MKINVTQGAKEYVGAKVTDTAGADLSGATFEVALGDYQTPPTTWQTPDGLSVDDAVATVRLLVDNVDQIGKGYLWVKVTDNPEVILLRTTSVIEVV